MLAYSIYTIICASKVNSLKTAGNYEKGKGEAAKTRKWSIIGIVIAIILLILAFISGILNAYLESMEN